MRNSIQKLTAGFAALGLLLCGIRLLLPFAVHAETDADAIAAEILAAQSGGNLTEWLDSLTAHPAKGTNDWYMLALAHSDAYALENYADALISEYQAHPSTSATSRERMALTMLACADSVPELCGEILRDSIGRQGIMSWVFGLHLLNNGVSADISAYDAVSALLNVQCADGGWAVTGQYGDPDVTAMVLQALAPYQHTEPVTDAVSKAIAFLSEKQLDSGAFSSFGTENPESTAQVLLALCSLGIAPDDTRFVKSGSLLDGIMQFSLGNGQFSHTLNGAANETAAVQVFLALTAMQYDRPFYLYHDAQPVLTVPAVTTMLTETVPHTEYTTIIQSTAETIHTDNSVTTVLQSATDTQTESAASHAESTVSTENSSGTQSESSKTEFSSQIMHSSVSISSTAQSSYTEYTSAIYTEITPVSAQNSPEYPYRIPITAGAGAVFLIVSAVCFIRGKRSPKTFLTLAFFCGGVTALAWIIKIESPEQYYQKPQKAGDAGSVTMAVRCDVILGMPGAEKFPADGVILPETEFALDTDDTALDVLYDAVKTYGLQIEVDGVSGDVIDNAYVRGIASLYEFDFGDLSGWTYTVNGERPSVGAGAYKLSDGDEIIWAYTVNL